MAELFTILAVILSVVFISFTFAFWAEDDIFLPWVLIQLLATAISIPFIALFIWFEKEKHQEVVDLAINLMENYSEDWTRRGKVLQHTPSGMKVTDKGELFIVIKHNDHKVNITARSRGTVLKALRNFGQKRRLEEERASISAFAESVLNHYSKAK